MSSHSVIQPSGSYGPSWPQHHNLPQGKEGSISAGGWTKGNEGFVQQTFLGASIRSFDLNAGFGDTTSSLSVSVVNDEYNKSDGKGYGGGDDVYHNGVHDDFKPPIVGSPVFFKFGKHTATIEQSWRLHFDDTYNIDSFPTVASFPQVTTNGPITTVPNGYYLISKTGTGTSQVNLWEDQSALANNLNHPLRGSGHFAFGGILQSYTENRGPGGNPLYNISVQDPREILSNATLILNNYAETTHNNKNLFNVYGFLEHSKSRELTQVMDSLALEKVVLTKHVDESVSPPKIYYRGKDLISGKVDTATPAIYPNQSDFYKFPVVSGSHIEASGLDLGSIEEFFPITGPGFSRRSEKGIPLYRVKQAVNTLFEYNGTLPEEYKNIGFGGEIDFRGYNYVVDFSGIPFDKIPALYYLDFDQIDLLSFVQELCEIISHDFFVSLLPVIDHPACSNLYAKNQYYISEGKYNRIITGIIRIDTIDKSKQPVYGAIKSYIDGLSLRDIYVENRDLGFEVSNVTTDKFVAGAQEVEMYYFNTEKDRDLLQKDFKDAAILTSLNPTQADSFELLQTDQWRLGTNLQQQCLPFYGFIGDECPTIPLGFGSYQQIKLDSSNLDAYGVGRYYVATEMELRAASVSYEQWRDFLLLYDEAYIQELGENQAFMVGAAANVTAEIEGLNDPAIDDLKDVAALRTREFGVGVPRCVHISDLNGVRQVKKGADVVGEYPLSPCAPPFGFPLYYKRAESIGIPQAGLHDVQNSITRCVTNLEKLEGSIDANRTLLQLNNTEFEEALDELKKKRNSHAEFSDEWKDLTKQIKEVEADIAKRKEFVEESGPAAVDNITDTLKASKDFVKSMPRLARQYEKNAKKVYNFVKGVADKHLGTTFLVRIPKMCNVFHENKIVSSTATEKRKLSKEGPFGFKPRAVSGVAAMEFQKLAIQSNLNGMGAANHPECGPHHHYLNDDPIISGLDRAGTNHFSNGALKNNYNTVSEQWDFNYKPEPQGGYLDEDKFKSQDFDFVNETNQDPHNPGRTIAPFWGDFIGKDGRIQCYVRYDNSQYLSFDGVSSKDMVQLQVEGSIYFPDIMDEIDNVNPHQSETFDKIGDRIASDEGSDKDKTKKSVAYLKCEIDDKFYMIPSGVKEPWNIFADSYRFKPNFKSLGVVEEIGDDGCITRTPARPYASPIFNPVTKFSCPGSAPYAEIETFAYYEEDWEVADPTNVELMKTAGATPNPTSQTTNKWDAGHEDKRVIVETRKKENLDPNHIYALVTLPVRVNPSVDQRYVDGPMMQFNAPQIRNALTADVTKFSAFKCPAFKENKGETFDCTNLSFEVITNSLRAQKSIYQKVSLALPEGALSFVSPSPVYPDLFALPLMSMERCYGPWTSSFKRNGNPNFNGLGDYEQTHIRYSNIGGKIEFEKDENLAPWNYAGYDLLADAAELKSNFSNSLLLFGERGGFVIPEAPTGISLAKALVNEGPLVTSISVSISNSIKTTVKMDLYTARFGKLHKQKEISVGKIVRETQKIKDEKNRNIRLGLRDAAIGKKSLTTSDNVRFGRVSSTATESSEALSALEKKQTSYGMNVGTQQQVSTPSVDADGNEVMLKRWESVPPHQQSSDHYHEALSAISDPLSRKKAEDAAYDANIPVVGMNSMPGANFNFAAPEYKSPQQDALATFFGINYDEIGGA